VVSRPCPDAKDADGEAGDVCMTSSMPSVSNGPADVVVAGAGGVVVEAGAAVTGAEVVAEEPELSLGEFGGVGRRGKTIVGISVTVHRLRARVDDDDMALFEVLD
jgi:hypothetical protein